MMLKSPGSLLTKRFWVTAVVLIAVSPGPTVADQINIALDNPHQSGKPGDRLIFTGSLTNTTPSSLSFGYGLSGLPPQGNAPSASVLDTGTGDNAPFSLAGFESSGTFDMIIIDLNPAFTGPFPSEFDCKVFVSEGTAGPFMDLLPSPLRLP